MSRTVSALVLLCTLAACAYAQVATDAGIWTGLAGAAMGFNYSAYIDLPKTLSAALGAEDISFEAWIRLDNGNTRANPSSGNYGSPTGETALNRPIVARWNRQITAQAQLPNTKADFLFQINPEGLLNFFAGGDNGLLGFDVTIDTPLDSKRWYHVAFSLKYAAGVPSEVTIYLNGVGIAGQSKTASWNAGATRQLLLDQPISVGYYLNDDPNWWPLGQYFEGLMDGVRFWKGAISTEQVVANWRQATPVNFGTSELVAQYTFDVQYGFVVVDSSANSFDGISHTGPFLRPISYYPSTVPLDVNLAISGTPQARLLLEAYDITGDLDNGELAFVVVYRPAQLGGNLYLPGAHPGLLGEPIMSGQEIVATQFPDGRFAAVVVYVPNEGATAGIVTYYAKSLVNARSSVNYPSLFTFTLSGCANGEVADSCGVCNGNNANVDACGVCFGDDSSCLGCNNIPNAVVHQCGVCNGNDACLDCAGVPNGDAVYDSCGVCNGNDASKDACGECGGDGSTCLGCDGVPASGLVRDICGVCGGDGTSCQPCPEGIELDGCGVCGGDNSTCGGCDGLGNEVDECGVCAGDGSSCTCVKYHGFHINEMDYILLQWGISQTIQNIDSQLVVIQRTLDLLSTYNGDVDLGAVVKYLCEFCDDCIEPYSAVVSGLEDELRAVLGPRFNKGMEN